MNIKLFRNVFSNIVICLIIISLMFVTKGTNVITATNIDAGKTIYRGNTENKNVSIMINVYWGTEYLEPMIEVLKEKNLQCMILYTVRLPFRIEWEITY